MAAPSRSAGPAARARQVPTVPDVLLLPFGSLNHAERIMFPGALLDVMDAHAEPRGPAPSSREVAGIRRLDLAVTPARRPRRRNGPLPVSISISPASHHGGPETRVTLPHHASACSRRSTAAHGRQSSTIIATAFPPYLASLPLLPAVQRVHQRRQHPGAARPDRVAQGHRPAVHVHLRLVQAQAPGRTPASGPRTPRSARTGRCPRATDRPSPAPSARPAPGR